MSKQLDDILHHHIREFMHRITEMDGFDEMKFNAKFKKFLMNEDFITKGE
jgi:hypothetical protein